MRQTLWRVCFHRNRQTEALVIKEDGSKPRNEQAELWIGQRLHSQATVGWDQPCKESPAWLAPLSHEPGL